MKLHLPKTLLVAVLAAGMLVESAYGAYTTLPDQVYAAEDIPTYTSGTGNGMTHLVYDNAASDGKVITNANFDIAATLWTGSGANNSHAATSTHTLVQFDGIISGSEKWQLNEYGSNSAGSVVYKFTNSSSTFTGTFSLESGNASANAESQLSLYNVGTAFSGAKVNFDADKSKAKGILSIESSLTLGGLTGGSGDDKITSTSVNNTLTLNVASGQSYTYAGTYGTGTYFSSTYTDGENFTKTQNDTAVLNITKTGAGTQTLSGTGVLGTVTVNEGKLSFTDAATLGNTTVADSASLVIGKAATLTGTLTGKLTIETLEGFEGELDGVEGNGFSSGTFQVLAGDNKEDITISYFNRDYTTDSNGAIEAVNYSVYFLNSDSATGSDLKEASANTCNTVEMAGGTTLTVDADFATVRIAAGAKTATLTVNNTTDTNPTIGTLSAAGAEVTVGGTSGLSITNATAKTLIANADINLGGQKHEVGALVINDGATVTTTYGDDGGNVAGFVKDSITINGGGTLKHTGNVNSPFGANTNGIDSITLGGTSGKTATLLFNRRTAIYKCSLTLKGYSTIGSAAITGAVQATETSNRDNSAVLDFIGDNTVAVSGTNNTINAALRLRNGTTTTFEVNNTTKDDVTTEGSVVLNGNIFKEGNDGSLTKSGDGKLTIASTSAVVHNANVTGGTLEIASGKTLTATGTMTIEAGTLALSSENAFAVTGAMTFNEGAQLSYTLTATPADIDTKLSYTLGTAGSFAGLDNLTYTGNTPDGYTGLLSADGNNLMLNFVLTQMELTSITVTEVVGFADGVLTLKTDAANALAYVFGEQLDVDIDDDLWKSAIADVTDEYAQAFSISLQNAEGSEINFGENQLAVVLNSQSGTVLSATTAGTYSVPEPTTATLSLLALAALAARRRRR
ncbi:MAG: PEP-CTERM sorting domain-containing protein [Akkermansia sp.]|nr:PEP-CTERM sorting domain-containing protein [Akkermansia sp.]